MLMIDTAIQKRIDMDLLNRSIPGIFIYAMLLPGVFWTFDFYTHYPELCLPYIIAMLAVSAARAVHKLFTDTLYAHSPTLWFRIFSLLTFMHAGILGAIFSLALYDPRFVPISHLMMLTMAAVTSGALMAQTSRVKLAISNMTVLLLPSVIACFIHEELRPFILMILIYYAYQIALGLRTNKEYIRGLLNEAKLEEQRQELEHTNRIDPLTNIYNRGYFDTAYTIQWNNSRRNKYEQSLLLIDIDHFKAVNDNYGHLFGDDCLKDIADILQQATRRETDLVARFGGEEFAFLLSNTPLSVAIELAEELRKTVENHLFSADEFKVTISIGVASQIPQSNVTPNSLIDHADKALYKAKREGRNQVCSYE